MWAAGLDVSRSLSVQNIRLQPRCCRGRVRQPAGGIVLRYRQVTDFASTYDWLGRVQLRNDKGVRIALQGSRAGMEFASNLSQITISLKK